MAWVRRLLGGRVVDVEGHRIEWEANWLLVTFPSGRTQRIRYEKRDGTVRLISKVAYRSELDSLGVPLEQVARDILRRNRETRVVAFGLGKDRRVEAWVSAPAEHLQRRELLFYLVTLAREADRYEYLLTRGDRS